MKSVPSLIKCLYADKQVTYASHYHSTHEIVYVKNGLAEFQVGGKTYEAGPGTLVFISNMEEHKTHILQGPYLRYFALLSSGQLITMAEDPLLCSVLLSRSADFVHTLQVGENADQVETLFRRMAEESSSERPFQHEQTALLFKELLILCYRMAPQYFLQSIQKLNPVILDIQRYIDEHLDEKLTVSNLAQNFFISESYLSHAFKNWTGFSPQRYLILNRLSLARELLASSGPSVEEIAARCGFSTSSHFIATFRKELGITPRQFRYNFLQNTPTR